MILQQLLFQDRVWYNGEIAHNSAKKLFFYHITYTNVVELCQKYIIHKKERQIMSHQFRRYIKGIDHVLERYQKKKHNRNAVNPILSKAVFIKKEEIRRYPFDANSVYTIFKKGKQFGIVRLKKSDGGWFDIRDIHRQIIANYGTKNVCSVRVMREPRMNVINRVDYYGNFQLLCNYLRGAMIWKNPHLYMDGMMKYLNKRMQKRKIPLNRLTVQDILNRDYILEYPKYDIRSLYHLILDGVLHGMRTLSMTLYRIGDDPSLFRVFQIARRCGVEVYTNIELHASGESKRNARWAKRLHDIGVHVRFHNFEYHIKTHSKLCLMQFDTFSIAQIGTGNYNTTTSSQYCDLSYITTNPSITCSIKRLFDSLLSNTTEPPKLFNEVLVTGNNFIERFTNEFDHERLKGKDGYIRIKCNGIDDDYMEGKIHHTLHAGVKIDAIIRSGSLLPNSYIKKMEIHSIVWDKLEHARIYQFGKTNPRIYIGSLDLRSPKITNRIEVLVKVVDPKCKEYLLKYLDRQWNDSQHSWKQLSKEKYQKL
jgi:polyphosphate kinase|nr:MAG TPA: Polyphosphate kinase C-terminal domain [Caudoviricetes sp.]